MSSSTGTNSHNADAAAIKLLAQPLSFPSGKTAPNRMTKAAMAEMLAHLGGSPPTQPLLNLYRQWANGGWGMIITGNVAVERTHLGMPFDISLPHVPPTPQLPRPSPSSQKKPNTSSSSSSSSAMWPVSNEYARLVSRFSTYADACKPTPEIQASGTVPTPLAIVQLVHAGRQSIRGFGRAPWSAPLAPSAVPMRTTSALGKYLGNFIDWLIWSHPRDMSKDEIRNVIDQFAASAKLCADAGFDGVELHASHGYLLSAFLSPRTNLRQDEYGAGPEGRMRILVEIVDAVRQRVGPDFVIGVKLNSSDYLAGGLTEEDALENVRMLAAHGGVDFVEISGGNYENPSFMGDKFDADAERLKAFGQEQQKTPSKRSKAREAFFLSFASRAHETVAAATKGGKKEDRAPMRIIVTGGLKTRAGMAECVDVGGADGVGLGRAAAVDPHLPLRVLGLESDDSSENGQANGRAGGGGGGGGGAVVGVREYKVPGAGLFAKVPIQVVGAGWAT
ncbi:hypothetical protein OC845_004757, partial [Tilletia horrida]